METSGLHRRLASVVGERSYAAVAEMTRTTPATARRYLRGHAPSVEFLQELCDRCEINAHWLLTGHGPMHARDVKEHALRHANPSELMGAIARALESLTDRLDRLETFIQTQEARLRATGALRDATGDDDERAAREAGATVTTRPAGPRSGRAESVADAIGERPSADADRADPPGDAGPGEAMDRRAADGA